ncbi:winged helix-turn-helix domain-containing protein [Thalassotalea euphylliae]|uniref:winged helix-turn-helix domain-containing protein n=1 Tax=Thalassotalea euphylliae TaxID=1655234 RepID=UPI00363C953C
MDAFSMPEHLAPLELSTLSRRVFISDNELELTGLEYNLLQLLVTQSPELVSREHIAQHIFNKPLVVCNLSINCHISNLRVKLGVHTQQIKIKSVRGRGYALVAA